MGCQLSLPYPLSQLWGAWGLPSLEAGGGEQDTEVNRQTRYLDIYVNIYLQYNYQDI